MGTDVDSLWAEMQAETNKPSKRRSKSKKQKQAPEVRVTPPVLAKAEEAEAAETETDIVCVDVHSLQRDINTVGDLGVDREERFASMQSLNRQIQAAKRGDPEEGETVWGMCLKPLVKRLYDDVEKIRLSALESLIEGFELTEAVLDSTPYVMPVIVDRMVHAEQFKWEPSEEARLGLIKLLRHLILLRPKQLMAEEDQSVLTVVVAATKDTAPEVKKVALSCVRPITLTVAHYSIWKQQTAMLMDACGRTLAHRHASVRLAGLEAIDAIMILGGAAEPLQAVAGDQIRPQTWGDVFSEETKNNFLAMMIQDGNPAVRREYFRLLGSWLSEILDKMDHEHLLAPYLLSGLSDVSLSVRETTIAGIEAVGVRYEADNALDFREEIEYGLLKHEDARFMASSTAASLPPPLKTRPRMGARVFVRSHAYRMIPCIIRELKEPLFTETVRLRSARLLRIILAYLEEHATKFTRQFVDAFMTALNNTKDDKDPELISTLLDSATLLGRFVDINVYLPFIQLDTVLGISNPAGSVMLAAAILQGMPPSGVGDNAVRFLELFVAPPDINDSDDTNIQDAALDLVCTFLQRCGEADAAVALKAAVIPEDGAQIDEALWSATKKAAIQAEVSRVLGYDVSKVARAPRPKKVVAKAVEPVAEQEALEAAEALEEIVAEPMPAQKQEIEVVEIEDAAAGKLQEEEMEIVEIVEEDEEKEVSKSQQVDQDLEELYDDSAMLSLD